MQNSEPKFFKTLFLDFVQFLKNILSGEFRSKVRQDFNNLKEYYFEKDRRRRLERMGWFKRSFYIFFWLIKSLFLKLSSFRRILLVFGILFLLTARDADNLSELKIILGSLIILLILLMELKDKLLAREELEAGRIIQRAFLPEQNPIIPGWDLWLFSRSANEVGGDLVDFLALEEDRFGIAVGDVAGKGLPAALLMTKLQATLRALTSNFTSLSEIAIKMNQIFYRDSLPERFASLVYFEITANSNVLRLFNAGHMPPIIIKNTKIKEMIKGAPALGILPEVNYIEEKLHLDPNDMLVIYSDGLTEARNETGDFFGEDNLFQILPKLATLPVKDFGEKLILEVDRFVGDSNIKDDLSLAILKCRNG